MKQPDTKTPPDQIRVSLSMTQQYWEEILQILRLGESTIDYHESVGIGTPEDNKSLLNSSDLLRKAVVNSLQEKHRQIERREGEWRTDPIPEDITDIDAVYYPIDTGTHTKIEDPSTTVGVFRLIPGDKWWTRYKSGTRSGTFHSQRFLKWRKR